MNSKQRKILDINARSQPEDKEILLWFIDKCNSYNAFKCLVKCQWVNNERVFSPTLLLIELSKGMKKS